jgi:hypothetical protein
MIINNILISDLNCYDSIVNINNIDLDLTKLIITPNPTVGDFNIIYNLPPNQEGKLEIFDMTGRIIYQMDLPKWTTLQNINLPDHISDGLYNCVITSGDARVSKKIAIVKQ